MKNILFFLYKAILLMMFLLAVSGIFAENANRSVAAEIETLLETRAVTYAQASKFVLEAANVLIADDPQEAFDFAMQENWLPKKAAPGDTARLDHISRLLMGAFETKGGIMYSLTKNAHYAYRELVYISVIQNRADPAMLVSGEQLLFYTNRMLAREENILEN